MIESITHFSITSSQKYWGNLLMNTFYITVLTEDDAYTIITDAMAIAVT